MSLNTTMFYLSCREGAREAGQQSLSSDKRKDGEEKENWQTEVKRKEEARAEEEKSW